MANDFSFSLLRFVFLGFSDSRLRLFAICLGLGLFQGCALLQRPPEIAAPAETPAQPTAPKTSVGSPTCAERGAKKTSHCGCEITSNRRSFVVWGATSRKADGQRNDL